MRLRLWCKSQMSTEGLPGRDRSPSGPAPQTLALSQKSPYLRSCPGRAPQPVLSLNASESMQGHPVPSEVVRKNPLQNVPKTADIGTASALRSSKSSLHHEIHQRLHRPPGRDCFAGGRQPRQRHWHSSGCGFGDHWAISLAQELGRQAIMDSATVRWSLTNPSSFRSMERWFLIIETRGVQSVENHATRREEIF